MMMAYNTKICFMPLLVGEEIGCLFLLPLLLLFLSLLLLLLLLFKLESENNQDTN